MYIWNIAFIISVSNFEKIDEISLVANCSVSVLGTLLTGNFLWGSEKKNTIPNAMANFTCQLDRARGCPEIWSQVILGVSVRMFG